MLNRTVIPKLELTFEQILERVVMAQKPELYLHARNIALQMLEYPKTIIVRVSNTSPYFPKPNPGMKWKQRSLTHGMYVRMEVMAYNVFTNVLVLADGREVKIEDVMSEDEILLEYVQVPIDDRDIESV